MSKKSHPFSLPHFAVRLGNYIFVHAAPVGCIVSIMLCHTFVLVTILVRRFAVPVLMNFARPLSDLGRDVNW